jgi:hypothetical protein
MHNWTDEQLNIYLAGFMDGDGTITIGKTLTPFGLISYRLNVQYINTCCSVLERIQNRVGGVIITKPARSNFKELYVLNFRYPEQRVLLPRIQPWVQVKIRQVEVALTFLNSCALGRGKQLTHTTYDLAKGLYEECSELNRRGSH